VVDHTGQYVSYYPPDEEVDRDSSDTEPGDTQHGNQSDTEDSYFPRNVFGDIVHRAAELRIDPTATEQISQLAEQYANEHNIALDRFDEDTLRELSEHIDFAIAYLHEATADADWSVDEIRVEADLTGGEIQGYIDHLSCDGSLYHIIDYKTNNVDSIEELELEAKKYRWQMRAYAVALHQIDPTNRVQATLLFTELDESITMEWTPAELDSLTETLSSEIRQRLN